MIETAYLCHRTLGRLRLRVPARKGDLSFFETLKQGFLDCNEVKGVEVNPRTASILLLHESDDHALAAFAEEKGLVKINIPSEDASNVSYKVAEIMRSINDTTVSATNGGLDLPRISFLTLMGFGIYQLSKGNFAVPPWYTAFWYAHGLFSKYLLK